MHVGRQLRDPTAPTARRSCRGIHRRWSQCLGHLTPAWRQLAPLAVVAANLATSRHHQGSVLWHLWGRGQPRQRRPRRGRRRTIRSSWLRAQGLRTPRPHHGARLAATIEWFLPPLLLVELIAVTTELYWLLKVSCERKELSVRQHIAARSKANTTTALALPRTLPWVC